MLELMLTGDSNGRPVAVPVSLILALVERVQRMASSGVKGQGPQVSLEKSRSRAGRLSSQVVEEGRGAEERIVLGGVVAASCVERGV